MEQTKMMTNSLSEETKENFANWLNSWDARIETMDDRETQDMIREQLNWCIGVIINMQNKSDQKVMAKQNTDEQRVKAMFQNQERQWYKDLNRAKNILLAISFKIEGLYELKHRKTHEIFKLRAELSKPKL